MASMWRRAMLYLGLGPDEEYDDYDVVRRADAGAASARPVLRAGTRPALPPCATSDDREPEIGVRRPSARSASPMVRPQPRHRVAIRPSGPARPWCARSQPVSSAKPHVVAPTSFNHAQEVADKFKVNQPVIVNLQDVDRDLSRRIIDFASGLCYGLGGQMERVANQVYLLTPTNVEVSAEERRRLQDQGYHERLVPPAPPHGRDLHPPQHLLARHHRPTDHVVGARRAGHADGDRVLGAAVPHRAGARARCATPSLRCGWA